MGSVMWSRGEEVCVYDGKFCLVRNSGYGSVKDGGR